MLGGGSGDGGGCCLQVMHAMSFLRLLARCSQAHSVGMHMFVHLECRVDSISRLPPNGDGKELT